jgi:hypothetical protein
MIRVGRRIYDKQGGFVDPSYPGFEPVLCLTAGTKYGSLSPYCLKDAQGRILENIWQFSKLYAQVPATRAKLNRYSNQVIWQWPAERHIDAQGNPNAEYWAWRQAGMAAPHPIRYPVGYNARHQCICAIPEGTTERLDYIQSRKRIYWPLYRDMVKSAPQFAELKEKLAQGKNLLIIEVDGPHQESLGHYIEQYGVSADFIENNTVLCNDANLGILLNDPKHPYGHGYCLAAALLGLEPQ